MIPKIFEIVFWTVLLGFAGWLGAYGTSLKQLQIVNYENKLGMTSREIYIAAFSRPLLSGPLWAIWVFATLGAYGPTHEGLVLTGSFTAMGVVMMGTISPKIRQSYHLTLQHADYNLRLGFVVYVFTVVLTTVNVVF